LLLAPIGHAAFVQSRMHDAHESAVAAGISLLGAVGCGLVPAMLWRLRAIGGGDVKLFAALGATAGFTLGLASTFYSFLFASAFVILRLAWRGTLLRSLGNGLVAMANPFLPKRHRIEMRHELLESLRFGLPICAGVAFAVFLQGGLS
jgi:prepilin peptidase CpaA